MITSEAEHVPSPAERWWLRLHRRSCEARPRRRCGGGKCSAAACSWPAAANGDGLAPVHVDRPPRLPLAEHRRRVTPWRQRRARLLPHMVRSNSDDSALSRLSSFLFCALQSLSGQRCSPSQHPRHG